MIDREIRSNSKSGGAESDTYSYELLRDIVPSTTEYKVHHVILSQTGFRFYLSDKNDCQLNDTYPSFREVRALEGECVFFEFNGEGTMVCWNASCWVCVVYSDSL